MLLERSCVFTQFPVYYLEYNLQFLLFTTEAISSWFFLNQTGKFYLMQFVFKMEWITSLHASFLLLELWQFFPLDFLGAWNNKICQSPLVAIGDDTKWGGGGRLGDEFSTEGKRPLLHTHTNWPILFMVFWAWNILLVQIRDECQIVGD